MLNEKYHLFGWGFLETPKINDPKINLLPIPALASPKADKSRYDFNKKILTRLLFGLQGFSYELKDPKSNHH